MANIKEKWDGLSTTQRYIAVGVILFLAGMVVGCIL